MANDTREDAGEYYPGGKVVPTRPITPGGGGGTYNYEELLNKPKIAGVELTGNKSLATIGAQATLVSGTNIKTVNGESLLGSGDIEVEASAAWEDITGKPDSFTPSTHASTHGTSGSDPITPADIGACSTNDSRLSNARTPTSHAGSHATGGTDAITPSAIGAQAEISDLSTIRSGAAAGATAVQSFSAVGGQTPTVSGGVANLSTLFSSTNTSLTSTIDGKLTADTSSLTGATGSVIARISALETSVSTANTSLTTALGTAASAS